MGIRKPYLKRRHRTDVTETAIRSDRVDGDDCPTYNRNLIEMVSHNIEYACGMRGYWNRCIGRRVSQPALLRAFVVFSISTTSLHETAALPATCIRFDQLLPCPFLACIYDPLKPSSTVNRDQMTLRYSRGLLSFLCLLTWNA